MASVFYVKQGDTRPYPRVRLDDGFGDPVNLTAVSGVKFQMRDSAGVTVLDAAAVPDPDQVTNRGYVEYRWVAGDTDTAGRFFAEWRVVFADGTIQTFPTVGFDVVLVEGEIA